MERESEHIAAHPKDIRAPTTEVEGNFWGLCGQRTNGDGVRGTVAFAPLATFLVILASGHVGDEVTFSVVFETAESGTYLAIG